MREALRPKNYVEQVREESRDFKGWCVCNSPRGGATDVQSFGECVTKSSSLFPEELHA